MSPSRSLTVGRVSVYAEIARSTGLTRARVTQLVDVTLFPPDRQRDDLLGAKASGVTLSELGVQGEGSLDL